MNVIYYLGQFLKFFFIETALKCYYTFNVEIECVYLIVGFVNPNRSLVLAWILIF